MNVEAAELRYGLANSVKGVKWNQLRHYGKAVLTSGWQNITFEGICVCPIGHNTHQIGKFAVRGKISPLLSSSTKKDTEPPCILQSFQSMVCTIGRPLTKNLTSYGMENNLP